MKRTRFLAFALIVFSLYPRLAAAQEFHTVDGPVYSMARAGNTLFAGGAFTQAGPATGSFTLADTVTGVANTSWPRITGRVYAIVSDTTGGWYIGGDITQVGSTVVRNIAHLKADMTLDTGFSSDANSSVYALTLIGGKLYAGGNFTFIGGAPRSYFATLNPVDGTVTSLTVVANGTVRALATINTTLYVGGAFSSFGGQARSRLAALDTTAGTVTSWNPSASNTVYAMANSANAVVVIGGAFHGAASIGGGARDYLAAVDTSGNLHPWNRPTDQPVQAIGTAPGAPGIVYIGGNFNTVDGTARTHAAALFAAGGLTGWNPAPTGYVYSILPVGTSVYIGGAFTSAGGASRRGLAATDPATGSALPFDAHLGGDVNALASDGSSSIAVGGAFSAANMQARRGLAAFDTTTGALLPFNVPVEGVVYSLAVKDTTLYIGGSIAMVGGVPRLAIAAVDTVGAVLPWDPSIPGVVSDMALVGNTLYIGGTFLQIGSDPSFHHAASFDLTTGNPTSWRPLFNSSLQSMKVDADGTLYVCGYFSTVDGQNRLFLASFDATGTLSSWNPTPDSILYKVMPGPDSVYLAGYFNSVGGKSRRYLAAVDKSTGTATNWDPQPNSPVLSLASFGSNVIVGGYFTSIGGALRSGIAAVDATTGVATPWNPSFSIGGYAQSFNASDHQLIAGGYFSSANNEPLLNLANVTPLNPVTINAPSGTARDGEVLSADVGTWSGMGTISTSHEWQRCMPSGSGCEALEAETGSTYMTKPSDVGFTLRTLVTASDSLSSEESFSLPTSIVSPKNSKRPSISGKPKVGQSLTASTGSWNGVRELSFAYQWQRCSGKKCSNIKNAKKPKYVLKAADRSKTIQVIVSSSKNGSAGTPATSKKTGAVK